MTFKTKEKRIALFLILMVALATFSSCVSSQTPAVEPENTSEVITQAYSTVNPEEFTAEKANDLELSASPNLPEATPYPSYTPSPEAQLAGRGEQSYINSIADIQDIHIFDASLANYSLAEKFAYLEIWFPNYSYWNSAEITTEANAACLTTHSHLPCQHDEDIYYCREYNGGLYDVMGFDNNIQCLGFASMISDFLFGQDAPVTSFYDFDSLQVGDHIRLNDYEHSMIVTAINGSTIEVLECNRDYNSCQIEWNRQIDIEEIESYDYVYMGRR